VASGSLAPDPGCGVAAGDGVGVAPVAAPDGAGAWRNGPLMPQPAMVTARKAVTTMRNRRAAGGSAAAISRNIESKSYHARGVSHAT